MAARKKTAAKPAKKTPTKRSRKLPEFCDFGCGMCTTCVEARKARKKPSPKRSRKQRKPPFEVIEILGKHSEEIEQGVQHEYIVDHLRPIDQLLARLAGNGYLLGEA
jgi:hypothetical protein